MVLLWPDDARKSQNPEKKGLGWNARQKMEEIKMILINLENAREARLCLSHRKPIVLQKKPEPEKGKLFNVLWIFARLLFCLPRQLIFIRYLMPSPALRKHDQNTAIEHSAPLWTFYQMENNSLLLCASNWGSNEEGGGKNETDSKQTDGKNGRSGGSLDESNVEATI